MRLRRVLIRVLVTLYLVRRALLYLACFLALSAIAILVAGIPPTLENIALLLSLNYEPKTTSEAVAQLMILMLEFSPLTAFMELVSHSQESKSAAKARFMRGHVIVVGCGHLGRRVVELLKKLGIDFVLVVKPEDRVTNEVVIRLLREGYPVVFGDATVSETLERAGVRRARAIIITINNDLINPIIAEHAKKLNPRIRTVVRIFNDELADMLRESPYIDEVISTTGIAHTFFAFGAFFDVAVEESVVALRVGSHLAGKSIRELARLGVDVAAVKRGEIWLHAAPDLVLREGDVILVLGRPEQMRKLIDLVS